MELVGIGLCLIGIGVICYDIILVKGNRFKRHVPKGKPAGEYESDMNWEFPED